MGSGCEHTNGDDTCEQGYKRIQQWIRLFHKAYKPGGPPAETSQAVLTPERQYHSPSLEC